VFYLFHLILRYILRTPQREEKFFSNAVTHVVTTRPIPREQDITSTETNNESSNNESQSLSGAPQTINPSLLDRSSEPSTAQFEARPSRTKFTFEAPVGRKVVSNTQDVDVRRQQGRNADVLHRARALGMKIWASEKLERMMITMFETDTDAYITHGHNTRSITTQNNATIVTRSNRDADLSQLLRNERINGPSDRDPTVAMKEMVIFKGPFIYIHDIDEKQKPIMVREYAKVSHKEDGDWPQFRSVSHGRCPFIEEIDDDRRDAQREIARQQRLRERETSVAPTTHAIIGEATRMEPPKVSKDIKPLAVVKNGANHGTVTALTKQPTLFEMVPPTTDMEHSSKGSQNIFVSRAGPGRMVGGEPVASGVQPSNITSAIRSQVISSTAAAPGAKAGTSKEVHGLQRKVLERNSGSATFGQTSSHRMTDFHNVVKEDPTCRTTKQRNKAKLDLIVEDDSHMEVKGARRAETSQKVKPVEKKKLEKPHGKLGYCENCMETFADFNEVLHIKPSHKDDINNLIARLVT
jgi:regulatory subunit for Cdc7p protein kinase